MKAVIQRVREASVSVGGEVVGKVDRGMLIFLCLMKGDGEAHAKSLAEKIAQFRFFEDAKGHMNLSAVQLLDEPLRRELGMTKAPGALVVSQFTLSADGSKGRRPSFDQAAAPDLARALVGGFVDPSRSHRFGGGAGPLWYGDAGALTE